jgi:hypothetical protein
MRLEPAISSLQRWGPDAQPPEISGTYDTSPRPTGNPHGSSTPGIGSANADDPDLALIGDVWRRLPEPVRLAIVAMVRATDPAAAAGSRH